jgi:hypothetical protein
VTTLSGDVITSGSSGIEAINEATSISLLSAAVVTVSAAGTIESGSILTNSGLEPAGIEAGFLGGTSPTSNPNVNGTVIVNNAANITAAAGWGIHAFDYGNGNVTVNDEPGTTVSGALFGIDAEAVTAGATGNVAINLSSGATVTGATGAIDATASTGTVTIDNFGTITGIVLTGNATFHNELGGLWNLAGASTFAGGTNIITNDGTIDTTGTSSIATTGVMSVINNGTVNVQSGSLDIGAAVTGTGTFTIANGAALEFGGSVGSGETITFLGTQGTLTLDHSLTQPFVGQLSNLQGTALLHDNIDLSDLVWTGLGSANYVATTSTSGVLTVSDGAGHSEVFDLVNYTGSGIFTVQKDSGNGTLVFDPPAPIAAATNTVTGQGVEGSAPHSGGIIPIADNCSGVEPLGSLNTDHDMNHFKFVWNDPGAESQPNDSTRWHFANFNNDQFIPSNDTIDLAQFHEQVPHTDGFIHSGPPAVHAFADRDHFDGIEVIGGHSGPHHADNFALFHV